MLFLGFEGCYHLFMQDNCEFLVAELPDGQLDLQDSYVIDEVSMMQVIVLGRPLLIASC